MFSRGLLIKGDVLLRLGKILCGFSYIIFPKDIF